MNPLSASSVALLKTLLVPLEGMNPCLGDSTVEFIFSCVCLFVAKTIICAWLEKVGNFFF